MDLHVRQLRAGYKVMDDSGRKRTIKSIGYGDGLIADANKTARVVVIEYEDGETVKAHPGQLAMVDPTSVQ